MVFWLVVAVADATAPVGVLVAAVRAVVVAAAAAEAAETTVAADVAGATAVDGMWRC